MAQEDKGCFHNRIQEEHEEGYKKSESVLVPPKLVINQVTHEIGHHFE